MKLNEHRKYWIETMIKISDPVLQMLAQNKLKETMPIEYHGERKREPFAHLEAFGRVMCGFTSWLEAEGVCDEEKELQKKYQDIVLKCLDNATNPEAPDFINFCEDAQPVVDAAFLTHGLVRAPKSVVAKLDDRVRMNLLNALRSSRCITPYENNWLMFSAMVETGIYVLGGEDYDMLRIKYALRQHMQWYKGDGVYGDGAAFHADYYNSFVIMPMLVDVSETFKDCDSEMEYIHSLIMPRASRYAALQERMISPEGTYPYVGRSITYRFGAFQALAQAAQEHFLPENVAPEQVRCGLTALIKRIMDSENTFDENGWMRIGVYGYQPGLGEDYICTGSLYMCCAVFLPLRLSPADVFWSGENKKWTAKKITDGEDMMKDHCITN